MSSLALVRAEIKSWERDFAATHGRDPSVQDIRDQPAIAEKYKLYKKLSKATAASQTPPQVHSRLPVPKSRPADAVPPPGFNPFSPVKKTAKHSRPVPPRASPSPLPNPFATPAKDKSNRRPRTATPSPDFCLRDADPSSYGLSAPTTAISRARKRLRGESVSPSPSKPKRQRVHLQAPPSPSKPDYDSSDSEHELDQELPQCDFTSSFVADSPIKPPVGGKSFKLLFDDALPALSVAKKPSPVAQPDTGLAERPILASRKPHRAIKSRGIASGPEHRISRIPAKPSASIFPTKDGLSAPSQKSVVPQVPQPSTSHKRTQCGSNLASSQLQYPLVPPSPPSQDQINRGTGKGKAKATAGRKRLKVEDQESEGADSPDDFAFKVNTVRSYRSNHRRVDDLEWDPLLHLGTRNHDSVAEKQLDANHHVSDTFSVDLPDQFRRVLAISPPRNQNSTEERVVRGLLYGDRVGHYDPSRGGDIWDAGETDEGALGDAETEGDWEGEPVPWEVGEL